MKNNQKGFSLIELSIVLIIIGLLVAGITGGASLINSAKLRSTMSEVTTYRIAVNNFYNISERYPGDGAVAEGASITNGTASGVKNAKILGAEWSYTWDEMADMDLLDSSSSYAEPGSVTDPYAVYTGLAYTKVSKSGWLMAYYATGGYNVIALTLSAQTGINAPTTGVGGITTDEVVDSTTGVDAGAMDTKMDDGTYNTGNVQALECTAYTSTSVDCVPLFSINL